MLQNLIYGFQKVIYQTVQKNAEDEYKKVLTKAQQKLLKFDSLITYQVHNLSEDENVIDLLSDAVDNTNGWSCTICKSYSK